MYELAAWATGPWTAVVLAWTYAIVVGLSNALPMQVGVARVVFAMGRDRQLPHVLARIHPRYHTPYVGMLVTAAISLAVALFMKNRLDDLASIVNFGALSGFLFLHVVGHCAIRVQTALARVDAAHWLVPGCGVGGGARGVLGDERARGQGGLRWLASASCMARCSRPSAARSCASPCEKCCVAASLRDGWDGAPGYNGITPFPLIYPGKFVLLGNML